MTPLPERSEGSAKVTALSGGVGGARFLRGLAAVLPDDAWTAVVNTGDDFEHWGLWVSPDLDTVMYTLSGLADLERGWGLAGETFAALERMRAYGEEDWFALGDRDLATHLTRTRALREGATLTEVTERLFRAVGVDVRVVPMADAPCRTMIDTAEGALPFQHWLVRRRAELAVRAVRFEGDAPAAPAALEAVRAADLVLVAPSNPYVSIDPILTRPGMRKALEGKTVVAVSPIVGGRAVKGPLGTMIPELTGEPASAEAVARHYEGLLSGVVVEHGDEQAIEGVPVLPAATVMRTGKDAARLARETLRFAEEVAR